MEKTEHIDFMRRACMMCDNSKCGYKTGCIAVKEGKVVLESWNEALAGEIYCSNGICDRQRLCLSGGKDIEKVCSIHAEAALVALAARFGISLQGADIYVTTFPCLICARLLAKSRIKNLFYMSDYMGENTGLSVLKGSNVEIERIYESDVWKKRRKILL